MKTALGKKKKGQVKRAYVSSAQQISVPVSHIRKQGPHFTECVIINSGMVWFHDGMFTGRSLSYETNNLTSISRDHAVVAFYSRDPTQNLLD